MMICLGYLLVWYLELIITSGKTITLKAEAYPAYENKVEIVGAISTTTPQSLIRCLRDCATSDKCSTFFFNLNLGRCVMHSKHFYYQAPSIFQNGWKYYITKEVTDRCPSPFQYYRSLDYCYTINNFAFIDVDQMKTRCSQIGGKLAVVDSQTKYDILVQIVGDRPDLNVRVSIQGFKVNDSLWILNDGQPLTYFNWFPGQPSLQNNDECLALQLDNQFFNNHCYMANSPGILVCEK